MNVWVSSEHQKKIPSERMSTCLCTVGDALLFNSMGNIDKGAAA